MNSSLANPTAIERVFGALPDLSACTVGLLMGGRSSEREVSLDSGRGVGAALRGELATQGPVQLPARVLDIEVEADCRWRTAGESREPCTALAQLAHIDVFFIALHGGEGEDGTLQGLLESAGRRYTGSGVRASAIAMDKRAMRGVAESAGLRVANGVCISRLEWNAERSSVLARCRELGHDGWVLKPRCGGSSVATFVVREAQELESAAERVLATGDDLLVEARVAGVELSCGVLGNHGAELFALTPIEICPDAGRFFDYEQKYSKDGARELCPPQNVSQAACARVRELSLSAHRAAGCDGYSRTDFIVPIDEGREREPVMLEVNTLPGMTARSLLPQEAALHGMDYTSLCLRLLGFALQRGGRS
jgi:D-alanine-D-alanine ligase